MWDRAILKGNARLALSGNKYWVAYAVGLIFSLANEIFNIIASYFEPKVDYYAILTSAEELQKYMNQPHHTRWIGLFSLLLTIFVVLPLAVGLSRFFVHNRFGDTQVGTLFSPFRNNYSSTVGAMLTTELFTGFWFLLFIIPGIIKVLQYWMVPFLLSDNPTMSGTRARQLSRMMTDGEKGAIFVLCLSFLGWFLLAGIVVGTINRFFPLATPFTSLLAVAFVVPYLHASFAELYIFLRDRAIQSGMVHPVELGLVAQPV